MAEQNFRVKRGLEVGVGGTVLIATPLGNVGVGITNPLGTFQVGAAITMYGASGIISATRFDGSINAPGKTYYVATNGSDGNTGNNLNEPYATLKHALSVATSGDTIFVQSGTFTEIFPLTVPVGVTIRGVGLRGTFIQPTEGTKQNDGFLLNGETTVEDLSIGNFYEPGYGFRFANNSKTTTRSPYIQRVTVLNRGSVTSSTDPYGFDTPHSPPSTYKAGRGALIDGSVVTTDTLEPAMLFNECTFITPNNTALEMTNGARTEWVNCFSYLADKGIHAYDGTVGVASTGYVRIKTSGIITGGSGYPTTNDELYYLEANYRSGTYSQVGTALTITRVGHGLTVGDRVFADFTSGTATDGFYRVTGYVGVNTFSVTMAGSATTSGNISYKEALGFGTVRSYTSATGLSSITGKGEGLFELPTSRLGKTVTAYGDAQLSTLQKKIGTASLYLDGTGDYARCEGGSDFAFSGNFTAETWIYPTSVTGSRYLFSLGTETTGRYHLSLESGVVTGNFFGSASTTFGGSISINTWTHIALVRSGSTITAYVNGTALGTTETNSSSIGNTGQLTIGADSSSSNVFVGYIDEVRISNTARYTGTFTPSTTQFNSDGSDKLLLHLDGASASTSFIDSSIPAQDIRWVRSGVGIATATKITLADYQQFGAEMRSIGSAVVFGNTGISADGPGVGLRLFAFNFGHIGSGKDFSQDISLVNQADEVVTSNNANVYFVSIDQSGDFRVGEAFYVNQEAGTVNFGGQNFTLNSLSDLNVTDGTNTNTLTPTYLTVGNIQISGNEITSTSGDININPSGNSETNIDGNLNVSGILTASVLQTSALQIGDSSIAIDDTGSNGTIRFNTDNIEAFRINNSQNIGIGTTNPTARLDVFGDSRFTGIITALKFDGQLNSGIATISTGIVTNLITSGIGTINTASVDLAYVKSGIVTNLTTTGIGTINTASVDLGYVKTGIVTNLTTTGIATIAIASVDLAYVKTGIVTNLTTTGIATIAIASVDLAYVKSGIVTNLTTTGIATINTASVDLAYVKSGIVTNLTTTGIGTINTASVDLAYVKSGIVTNLTTTGIGTINTASVDLAYVNTGIVTNLSTSGIATIATASVDLAYVKSGIITNLTASGIATINTASVDLAYVNSGIVTNLTTTGIGTITTLNATTGNIVTGVITDLSGSTATYTTGNIVTGIVTNLITSGIGTIATASVDLGYVKTGIVTNLTTTGIASIATGVVTNLITSGIGTINTASIDLAYIKSGIVTNLTTTGIGTIATASVDLGYVKTGIITNLTTSGIATIATLNATTGNIVTGLVTTISGTTATYTTGNIDTLNATTGNIVTGLVTTISGTTLNYSGVGTITTLNSTNFISGIATATTRLSTGASGVGINITQNTISGPSEVIIDPAGVGDNTGSVRIKGDLYVDGTTTQINSTSLEIADFIVGIASTATTDLLADGAGIKIGPNNTLLYDHANTALKSSENFNLASGKVYEIDGTNVLSSTTLGSGVVNSSLTSVGTLGQLNVSGVATFQSDVKLGDNNNLYFGDGNDLRIVHDGSNSYITDQGTGNLAILGDNEVWIGNTAASEYKARFITNGAVELYYDASKKFETTGYGATVFGTLQSPQLNVTGIVTATGGIRVGAAGSIGIGTTNPTAPITIFSTDIPQLKLNVSADGIRSEDLRTNNTNTFNIINKLNITPWPSNTYSLLDLGVVDSNDSYTGGIRIHADGNVGGSNRTAIVLGAFYTGLSELNAITIRGTGLVGIGSADPTSKLDVGGNVKIVGIVTASSFVKSGGTSSQFLKADGSVDSSTYLTSYTETDTLNSVTTRGNVTSNGISVGLVTVTQLVIGTGVTLTSGGLRINSGIVTASQFVRSGGTSSQFLKADGSVDSSTYLTSYTETDTLDSVTTRGRTTSNGISVGVLTATSLIKSGGTSSQFLKADGSVDSSTYSGQIEVREEGTQIGTAATTFNFVGAGVTATYNAGITTITISGGGGGSGAPGGSDTQVQFNDGGSTLGGDSGLTYNKTTDTLSVTGGVNVGTGVTILPSGIRINTGIVTAQSFVGDGSGLTGVGFALTVGTRTAGVNNNDAVSNVKAIRFAKTPFSVTDLGSGEVLIQSESTFNPWYVNGQGTLKATGEEPIEFIAGPGIAITTKEVASAGIGTTFSKAITFNSVPSGSDTQIQFNDGGSTFGGDSGLTYNKTTDILSVTGGVNVGTGVTILPSGLRTNTGIVTASSFVKSGGTSSQFLKADGSVDSSAYITSYAETDTLDSVTTRGRTTTNGISVGLLTATSIVKSGGTSSQFLKADGSVDSSTYLTTTGNGINLTGIVTSIVAGTNVTISGSTGQVTINAGGGGSNIAVQDEGSQVGTAATVLNFVGAGVTATYNAGITTITISGGGGGGSTNPGGSDTQVQFNDGGSTFGGDSGLTYNKTTDTLSVTGGVNVGTGVTILPSGIRINTGIVTASQFVRSGGTSSQFLKADGSVDSSTYLTSYTETDTLDSVTTRGRTTTNGISVGIITAANQIKIQSSDSNPGRIDLFCEIGNAHYTRLQAAPHNQYGGNAVVVLPAINGDMVIGNTSVAIDENINTTGIITANSFVKPGSTSSEFLKGDGSTDANTYLTTTGNGVNLTGIVTSIVAGTNVTISGSTGKVTINASGGGGSSLTVQEEGSNVGTAATTLNFVGSGVTATYSGGTATITISGGGGGGGGTPGGSDTQIQFNDGGSTFGGDSGLTYNKTTDTLTVAGGIIVTGVVTATDFNSSSDAALKNNVRTIEDPLAKVMSIRGVNFEWKENGQSSAGVLAQEIEKIMPELVRNSTDNIKSVNYNGLIGLLIEVVKEQQNQINELKSKLS